MGGQPWLMKDFLLLLRLISLNTNLIFHYLQDDNWIMIKFPDPPQQIFLYNFWCLPFVICDHLINCKVFTFIGCIGVSTPLNNKPPLLKSANCPSCLFKQLPPIDWFFVKLPKNRIFQCTPIILIFFSLTPSYLLKVTKFLVKILNFKFLVMTEKHFCLSTFFCYLSTFSVSYTFLS